ncbi:DUF6123 family protein [Ferdinandcohnia quinoae]|uniref:DUF6123 family protein n=1 Tax=Fredinandcohnia quinoae TaxID=2918902 RepID=A0AAW5E7Y3_9BACI|nr:DUF6123 family protein [Fredinandcohnia sp. SECRCQ15]MCH1627350.1 DUF6123 family protein [Fredinandcohnia sp. SECRCQ15]
MLIIGKKVDEYLQFLAQKGFQLGEDAIGFIAFGQSYTDSSEDLVIVAIELTLKAQKEFDGSFFISLLEMLKENNILTRTEALQFTKMKKIIQ